MNSIGDFKQHEQPVWDLQHHPTEQCLLSLSADDTVCLWSTFSEDENQENIRPKKIFQHKEMFAQTFETPTSCTWLGKQSKEFAAGYVSNNKLIVFDA